jgi:hypothetical protein
MGIHNLDISMEEATWYLKWAEEEALAAMAEANSK